MEDDEDIQSHQSPAIGSPDRSPSPANDRITMMLAAAEPPSPRSPSRSPPAEENALALALLIPPTKSSNNKSNGGGREDCWSESATEVLIDAWGDRYLELSRGNLKQKHWKEVADVVSSREDYGKTPKTDIQCKNRIDTVKKKYKQEKVKLASGAGTSKWVFFEKLDRLIGPSAKVQVASPAVSGGGLQRVPMGIPMSTRSNQQQNKRQKQQQQQQHVVTKKSNTETQRWRFKKRNAAETDSESEPELSADSADSLPPPVPPTKKVRVVKQTVAAKEETIPKRKQPGASSVKEFAKAVLKFGEIYEQAEYAKLQQVVEMEKQRMKFVKEIELQRMQFFMKTQLEISQLRSNRRGGIGNTSNDHINNNMNNKNHSDSST